MEAWLIILIVFSSLLSCGVIYGEFWRRKINALYHSRNLASPYCGCARCKQLREANQQEEKER